MAEFILKDWYGKDCRFNHDTIFVQDANGKLVQFTQGKGNPTLEELEVTENGLYTPKGTVDGFNRVVVDVASEINEMLFNKTNFSGFASGDKFNGLHTKTLIVGTDIDSLKIIDGREYTVYWDDVNYTTYAKDTNYIIEEAVGGETIYRSIYYLGNGALLGLNGAEDTGEPFALQYTQSKELLLVSTDTAESHSVAIMKRVRPRDGLEMMLQSLTVTANGEYTANSFYDGLKTVTVDVPIPEVVLQDKTITENGTFTADEGFDGLGSITVEVAGAGASDDVRYVTFMSYDGTIEYGKKAVAVGDDCADPIARGIFGTPTRESDAQYNYTHNGWSTEVNGLADSTWNEAITEDKTVYASFASDLRYYTITYYDSDGTTVLKTESLAYGSTPSYKPEKSGVSFSTWIPETAKVTGDASYVAVWEEKISFAGGSWDDIIAISESGKARENFAIGDKKTITIGDTSVDLMIIGFDHDEKFDGTGKAGMTLLTLQPLPDTTAFNSIGVLLGHCDSTLVSQLPEVLRNAIKPVNKRTRTYNNLLTSLEWKVFPLSMTDAKIRKYQSRQYGDADWDDLFEDGGTPYEYFETNYNTTLMGPAYKWLSGINDTWMRNQVKINSKIYNVAGKYPPVTTTSSMYAHTTHVTYDTTTKKSVLFAFCI